MQTRHARARMAAIRTVRRTRHAVSTAWTQVGHGVDAVLFDAARSSRPTWSRATWSSSACPCLVDSGRFGMKPLTFCALGEVRILVREDWLQVAQRADPRPRERAGRARASDWSDGVTHEPGADAPHRRRTAGRREPPRGASPPSPTWRSSRSTRRTHLDAWSLRRTPRRIPASTRSRAAPTRACTAASCGRCASSPASARRRTPTSASSFLLAQGQTGLSTAFDMPTLMGYDADHPRALGEVGREGVAVSSLADMEALFAGIPLDQVTTSMTINCTRQRPAGDVLRHGRAARHPARASSAARSRTTCSRSSSRRRSGSRPPAPSMRIIVDMIEFCAAHAPRWHPVSISGYHIREAGSTAVQELAFTLADGIGYVQAASSAASTSTSFAPRLSFFFDVHNDFFEEIAKFRAARRMWATIMRERFGAKKPRSLAAAHARADRGLLADRAAAAQQRRARRPAGAGRRCSAARSRCTPTRSTRPSRCRPRRRCSIALRTQQIIAEETGVANIVDPLGGSYSVETLTDRLEREAFAYIEQHRRAWAASSAPSSRAIPQQEIAEAAYRYQRQLDRGEKVIVGVNKYQRRATSRRSRSCASATTSSARQVAARARAQAGARRRGGARRARPRCAPRRASGAQPDAADHRRGEAPRCTVGEISDVFRDGVRRLPRPGVDLRSDCGP